MNVRERLRRRGGRTSRSPRVITLGSLLLGVSAGACAGGGDGADSARAAPPAATTTALASAATDTTDCPSDGRWRACNVAERLEQAGLAPRPDTAAPLAVPFLTGRDTVLRLGLGRVYAFVYDDTAALAREVAALDTGFVAPRGQRFAWPEPPTFIRSANLVAVALVSNARQLERVQLALEAGPPQRNPDRP